MWDIYSVLPGVQKRRSSLPGIFKNDQGWMLYVGMLTQLYTNWKDTLVCDLIPHLKVSFLEWATEGVHFELQKVFQTMTRNMKGGFNQWNQNGFHRADKVFPSFAEILEGIKWEIIHWSNNADPDSNSIVFKQTGMRERKELGNVLHDFCNH